MELHDWLDKVSPYVNLAAIVVTAIATAILGWFTAVLAKETRRMVDAASRPHVVATIELNAWSMIHADLKVDNTGNATAYDIEVSFDPPLRNGSARESENTIPFEKISVLKPGTGLTSYLTEFGPILGSVYTVTVSWKRDPAKAERQTNKYSLSMRDFDGVSQLGASNPLTQIATEVKHIREDWRWVASGSRKIKADVFSSADRLHERRQIERRWRREQGEAVAEPSPNSEPTNRSTSGSSTTES